ncbi:MAG: zeta toxin family protein, partial [Neisseriaceae bacterium]|nr:zeta toxin family protein [Neisseriaceae bacterium]
MSRSKSADKPGVEFIEKLYATQVQQKNLTPATHPNVVFVTGVAGSGKSYNTKNIKENPAFNVFSIHPDDYRKLHPKINHLIEKYGRDNTHEHTGSFSNRTALALRDKAIEDRLIVVYEATFGNIETAKNLINSFADNGYRVTVIALPVNLELSIERNESRYQAKKEDIHTLPRKVSKEDIQKMADNFMN